MREGGGEQGVAQLHGGDPGLPGLQLRAVGVLHAAGECVGRRRAKGLGEQGRFLGSRSVNCRASAAISLAESAVSARVCSVSPWLSVCSLRIRSISSGGGTTCIARVCSSKAVRQTRPSRRHQYSSGLREPGLVLVRAHCVHPHLVYRVHHRGIDDRVERQEVPGRHDDECPGLRQVPAGEGAGQVTQDERLARHEVGVAVDRVQQRARRRTDLLVLHRFGQQVRPACRLQSVEADALDVQRR